MVGVVEGMRWVFLNSGDALTGWTILISGVGAAFILATGLYVFQGRDPELADVI
jgi:hypothetical protein